MSQKKLKKIRKIEAEVEKQELFKKEIFKDGLLTVWKKNWIFLTLISFLVVLVFTNGLKADFVSDDYATIPQNPNVGDAGYMWKSGGMASLSNWMDYKLFGFGNPLPYHLTSLILYVVFLWLAFGMMMLVFEDRSLSLVSMTLFAFHPIHVEAVTWISGRIYVLLAIFITISFLSFLYFLKYKQKKYLVILSASFLLGFMTDRPRPISFFLIAIFYIFYKGIKNLNVDIKKFFGAMAGVLVLLIVVALPYINNRIATVNSGINSSGSIFYNPFFQYPIAITKYLQLLWAPVDLTLYHTMYFLPDWLNWAVLLLYLTMVFYFYFKDKRYFWVLAFIFAATLPSMSPIKVSWLVAERYMFLGSFGFCLLLGLIISDFGKRFKFFSTVLVILIVTLYGIRSFLRNIDWQTNHKLWVITCQVSPNSHNAWNNIGDDYDKLKDYASAIKGFTQSTIVKPNYADAYHNRANIFFKIGRLDLARESYETAMRFNPGLYQTYISLVQIDLNEKKLDLALQHISKAVELDPNNPQTLYILAVVYAQGGKIAEAKNVLNSIISKYPNYVQARNALTELEKVK
jgi:tetratricopeptide (TPR) repeat protein